MTAATAAAEEDFGGGPDDRIAVSARGISVHGPWGHSYGPVDLDIAVGGVTVLAAPTSRGRSALMLTLCGRMRPHKGSISIMGFNDKPRKAFRHSAIALLDEVDEIEQSVRVRDLITETRRWNSSWYKLIRRANSGDLDRMCGPLFGDLPLPPLHEFVDRLPELQIVMLRLAIANAMRPPLLVIGGIDDMSSDNDRAFVYERLARLGERQTVVVADENARSPIPGCREIIPLPYLTTGGVAPASGEEWR